MRIAVTGSAGFIGQAVTRAAHRRSHEVIPVDRADGYDILDAAALRARITGCDAVVHLAGLLGTDELFDAVTDAIDVNVHGTRQVLEAAAVAGAAYVGITMPDAWPSIYQATKLAATRLAEAFHHCHGIPVTHIRAFNAYGPAQKHGRAHPQKIVPTFATAAWSRVPMPVWGSGRQTVDLVHVDAIARRLVLAAEGGAETGKCQTWDAGTGKEWTVLQVTEAVGQVTGFHQIEQLPMRRGELENTRLCATQFGPWPPSLDEQLPLVDQAPFVEAVESYRP